MTDGEPGGAGGGIAGVNGRPVRSPVHDRTFLGICAAVLIAIATVNSLSSLHDRPGRIEAWEPFVWEFTSIVVLFGLTPLLMTFVRRVWPLDPRWARTLSLHAIALAVFSTAHIAGMELLRWLAYRGLGHGYPLVEPLDDFFYEFRKDMLVYAALVGIYVAWVRLTSGLLPAPGPPSLAETSAERLRIEVRDGARRRFVDLTDIDCIEAAGNYVELRRGDTRILHRAALSSLAAELADAGFVRIHRSRLVRRAAIRAVESKPSGDFTVELSGGECIAGSRRYRRPLLEP